MTLFVEEAQHNGADAGHKAFSDLGHKVAGDAQKKSERDESSPAAAAAPLRERVIDSLGRSYGTGKKKCAIARVWIRPGKGQFTVNTLSLEKYLGRDVLRMIVGQPFQVVGRPVHYDVVCSVKGGGLSSQAYAIRHGISKALSSYEPTLYPLLKKAGFMTRDSRVVERKKYGRHKARKSTQFSKR